MRLIRTFHPVGQGVFYTEEFRDEEKRLFRVVFDCGSTTLKPRGFATPTDKLGKLVLSELGADAKHLPDVDVLFLSHFDMDHINGCRLLNPKLVVIPFLTPVELAYLRTASNSLDIDFYYSLPQYFRDAKIIRILPADRQPGAEGENGGNIPTLSNIIIDRESLEDGSWLNGIVGRLLDMFTGGTIRLPEWEYMMYNPNMKDLIAPFVDAVAAYPTVSLAELEKPNNGAYVRDHIDELRKIYRKLRNMNGHSLQVYSGATEETQYADLHCKGTFMCIKEANKSNVMDRLYDYELNPGCLYTGDVTMERSWIGDWFSRIGAVHLNEIGIVQIPHHGSDKNNVHELLVQLDNPKVMAVISAGTKNRYGHPSLQTVQDILYEGHPLAIVTEDSQTAVCQTFGLPDDEDEDS